MKRMKVFIIAIISVLLIVILGNVTLAEEPTVIKSIGDNGKVLINLDDLKTKYANVLCVARGVSVQHGKHESHENSEYYLLGTAEISGNSAILTQYTWEDQYTKVVKGDSEEITTDNGESNKVAAILTTNNFYNGYAGGKVYDENMNLIEEEEASHGPRQLCIWGYWNTWVKSLPQKWQSVFKTSDGNKMKTEQEISWYQQDMAEIENLVSYYSYKVKISFVEHICKNSKTGLKETTGQRVIIFEILDPEVEITVEKIWDDIIYDENGNIVTDNSRNRPSKLDVLVETYLTETNYNDMVHVKGEDKIVELTKANNWKSTLKLKVRPNKEGYSSINRIYKVREVVEVQDGQNVKVDVVKVPRGEEPKVDKTTDPDTGKQVQIVTVSGEEVSKTYKEPIVAAFPKVEVKEENGERILYVAGKKVVRSAYVDGVEVEDVLEVSGHKVVLKANEKYVEPQTQEEIANRTDTPIQNKKYAVVKLGKTLVGTSYILEDQTMIQVVDNLDAGTTSYNQYVESNIDVEDKKVDMTNTRAYVRFTNKLEVVNIPVNKVWSPTIAELIERGLPEPKTVTVQLLANGEIVNGKTITLNASNNWVGIFENLMKYDNQGNEIKYTIQEGEILYATETTEKLNFDSEITYNTQGGYTITNKIELVDIPVNKVWSPTIAELIERGLPEPKTVTVQLLANGEIVSGKTIILESANNWKGIFKNLMKYDNNGNEIKYTIQEGEIEYATEVTEKTNFASEITGDVTNGYTITNTYYDGYYEIKGTVWYDGELGKSTTPNGILDNADIGMQGIKVTLMYGDNPFYSEKVNGEEIVLSSVNTEDDGTYTIKVNYDNRVKIENGESNLYKLYESASEVERKLSDGNAWIKFEYDGMAYTTIPAYDSNYESEEFLPNNTSKASENIAERTRIDNKYFTVNSETPEIEFVDTSGIPSIKYPGKDKDPNGYWSETTVFASTKGFIGSFIDKGPEGVKTYNSDLINEDKSTEIIKYCQGDTDNNGLENYRYTDATNNSTTVKSGEHDCTNCNKTGHVMKQQEVEVTKINGVNLGLAAREKQDVKLDSTIHKVDVFMNGDNKTYKYNEIRPTEPNNSKEMYQTEPIYIRRLNTANVILANKNPENIENLLSVYVTYSIGIGKQGGTISTTVSSIINDYDSRYTIDSVEIVSLDENGEAIVNVTKTKDIEQIEMDVAEGTHNRVKLNYLDIKAEPGCNSEELILIRYKVSPEAIKELLANNAVLNNAVEVNTYESHYGSDTNYYADKNYAVVDKPYAGYDKDSHPGNAGIKLVNGELQSTENTVTIVDPGTNEPKTEPEDDTDIAPKFELSTDDIPNTIAGTVWTENDEGTETGPDNYRVGNGKIDEGETNLVNVKVELINATTNETAKLYRLYKEESGEIKTEEVDAIVYTDNVGNYSFNTIDGKDGYSILIGSNCKYYIRFTYGNNVDRDNGQQPTTMTLGDEINARNYKSTIISRENEILYNYFKDDQQDYLWHLKSLDNYSIAVDNMDERIIVDEDLYYGNFDEEKNISAESKPFVMTIEFTTDSEIEVEADGETLKGSEEKLKDKLEIFDLGIIERAREDLVVSKTINYMDVNLVDGSSLASGSPVDKEKINFVKAQGLSSEFESKSGDEALNRTSVRQAMLEMDSEITQGATVKLQYKILVTNNGEKDIDYRTDEGNNYYKFGEIPANPENYIMSSSVKRLVTYVNKDLVLPKEDTNIITVWDNFTADWDTSYKADTLKDATTGKTWISETTKNAIQDNNYIVLVTEKFTEVKPGECEEVESIIADKRLTFKEDNAYDIHSEILVIDGKVARTINSVENGKQIPKTYKSGNFVPSLDTRKVQITDEANGNYRKVKTLSGEYKLSQSVEEAGVHEQDDDTVKVTVTQPTGITKYITTYVIATLIGLIVIVIGIVFIKKKVLTR